VFTASAAIIALLYFLRNILIPLVIAFVLAVLVEALVAAIGRRWPAAPRWLVSWLAGIVVILTAAGGIFVLARGTVQTVAQAPALTDRLDAILSSARASLHITQPLDLKTLVGHINGRQIASFVLSSVQDVGGTVILVIIYFGFMLGGRKRLNRKFNAIAGSRESSPNRLLDRAAADIRTYLWVQTVTGVMITAAATAVMLVVGLNNVLFWTAIFFLLTFIPNIGVTVGSVAPALFALLQFPTKWQAVAIFAVIQVAAFIVGNVIYPRMQAETQNIDPIATILALSFWTFLWGLTGAFLAVPMTLMMMMIFAQFDSTRWISAALSNDGKPDFSKSA
jgi:AI-2 transport protein TqsA